MNKVDAEVLDSTVEQHENGDRLANFTRTPVWLMDWQKENSSWALTFFTLFSAAFERLRAEPQSGKVAP
jgi:hypothetical protein